MRISPITCLGVSLATAATFFAFSNIIQNCIVNSQKEKEIASIRKQQKLLISIGKHFLKMPLTSLKIDPKKAEQFLNKMHSSSTKDAVARKMKEVFFRDGYNSKRSGSPNSILCIAMHNFAVRSGSNK